MILTIYSFILYLPFVVAIFGTVFFSLFMCIKTWIKPRSSGLPKLYFKDSALAAYLLKRCRLLNRKFDPPWWLRNAHVQTVVPYLFSLCATEFDREYLQTKDKGVVALDWVRHLHTHKRKQCTILLVIPGLTGSAVSVSKLCSVASKKGFRPVVFNQRGFGNSVLTTAKILSVGDPNDLRQVVKYIYGLYPKPLITMLGYGTGCSLVLSYLGEYGSSANLHAAACISPCFDITERFSKGLQGLYDILYLLKLKVILSVHSSALAKCVNFNKLLRSWTFKTFDEIVYAKLYNFTNAEEFWDKNNPLRDVDEISVPLLFINSLDDPFYFKESIPYDLFKYYPHFLMVATGRGGHCGFVDKLCDVSWAEALALDYLDSVLEFINKGYSICYGKNRLRSTI